MKKKTKYSIKNGQVVINKTTTTSHKKLTGYERYVNIAQGIGIPKSEIFSQYQYEAATAGEISRNLPSRPKDIAYKQKYRATEKQTRAYWKAYKRTNDGELMTYKEFINDNVHLDIPDLVNARYAQLKEYYSDDIKSGRITMTQISHMISSEFFGS